MKTGAAARAGAILLGLALSGALAGCGSLAVGVEDDWHAAPLHSPLPHFNVVVAQADLARICGDYPGKQLYGCAQRRFDANVCVIYTAANPADWLIAHERKHCDGYDHGAQGTRTAAVSR